MNRTKVLIWGSSPVLPCGKSEAIRLIFGGLKIYYPGAYEIHQIGLFHSMAVTKPDWPVYPTMATRREGRAELAPDDLLGQRTACEAVRTTHPDVVFLYATPAIMTGLIGFPKGNWRLVIYLKLDDFPFPRESIPLLEQADSVITMSESSAELVLKTIQGMPPERVSSCYSPADTARFHSLSLTSKLDLRRNLFPEWIPERAFVLGWIGRGYWRKQIWLLYKLVHYIRYGKYIVCEKCQQVTLLDLSTIDSADPPLATERRPGCSDYVCAHCYSIAVRLAQPLTDIFLWLHVPKDDAAAAWPLASLERIYRVRENRDIFYTQGYNSAAAVRPEDMPALYQVWDALIYLSGAEGFGLPVWEAMCSSLPVVYSNFSSHAELLGRSRGGLAVGGLLQPERKTGFVRMIANLEEAVGAVRKLYFDRALGCAMGEAGRSFVENYTIKNQARTWHAVFQGLNSKRA